MYVCVCVCVTGTQTRMEGLTLMRSMPNVSFGFAWGDTSSMSVLCKASRTLRFKNTTFGITLKKPAWLSWNARKERLKLVQIQPCLSNCPSALCSHSHSHSHSGLAWVASNTIVSIVD